MQLPQDLEVTLPSPIWFVCSCAKCALATVAYRLRAFAARAFILQLAVRAVSLARGWLGRADEAYRPRPHGSRLKVPP